jgi:hypothetical protein
MRSPWITAAAALRQRMLNPMQLNAPAPEAEMPAYMESFLAHLRVMVGVPFDYLVADSRLLPDESIRFFYVDRSWTDRLVDGAISVGKIGTREQAHHQAHSPVVQQQLDLSERIVRILQRGLNDFPSAKGANDQKRNPADMTTGFLLRSAAVSGWPHIDVRAFNKTVEPGIDPSQIDPNITLPLLRLERLSPSVLIALFEGVPELVWCEEPHHGLQFGVQETASGKVFIPVRDASGHLLIRRRDTNANLPREDTEIPVPMRAVGTRRVIAVAQLRRDIIARQNALRAKYPPAALPPLPAQTGAAGYAIAVLNPPWRQRFEGQGGSPGRTGTGAFDASIGIAAAVERPELQLAIRRLLT